MWSSPVTTVEPESEPVTLAQAKEFLSIDAEVTDFDTQLGLFITAARQQAENVTGTRFVSQTVQLSADCFADLERLPIGPAISVASIAYLDTAGDPQTIAEADYELFGAGLEQGIRPVFGGTWPTPAARKGAITVTMLVGYASVPQPVWLALLRYVADMFAFRETAVTGTVAQQIPMSSRIEDLLVNHRLWL